MTNYMEVAARIMRRCQDLEVDAGAGPGGPIDSLARKLSRSEVSKLIGQLDHESLGEADQIVRNRYNNVVDFLREILRRREAVNKKLGIKQRAGVARRERRETCDCGAAHPPGANFYVTVTDGGKLLPLAGPYKTHAEAVAMVDEVKELAIKTDPSAAFASFGTTAMPGSYAKPGIFN